MDNLPATAIEYVKPEPMDFDLNNPEQLADFRSQTILKIQGKPIELSEKMPIDQLALTFSLAFEVSSEAVLRLKKGELVLLFSHHEEKFLSKDKIDETILNEIEKAREKAKFVSDIALSMPEFIVDLGKEWKKIKKGKDDISKTKEFIKEMPKILKPALNIVFKGKISALPFLCLIYFSRSYGHNIFYKEDKKNKITLFSKY